MVFFGVLMYIIPSRNTSFVIKDLIDFVPQKIFYLSFSLYSIPFVECVTLSTLLRRGPTDKKETGKSR